MKRKLKKSGLPSVWELSRQSFGVLKQNWRLFGGISLVYGLLLLIFVRGIGGGIDINFAKEITSESIGEAASSATTSLNVFTNLLSGVSAGNSELVPLYQTIILIICSLAMVWALRKVSAKSSKTSFSARDAFYRGMHPLIPFVLVVCVISIELIPITLASNFFSAGVISGIAVTTTERIVITAISLLLTLASFYMITSSIFAAYIVTLPNVKPLQALRSAKKLVMGRRLLVLRKLLFLPIIILLVLGLVVVPLIAFLPIIAELVFFSMTIVILPVVHAYIYNLYKAML